MSNIVLNHPAFSHTNDIKDICNPLGRLNITYFVYVHIDNQQNFAFLNNSPEFLQHYLSHEYYNADIPSAKVEFGRYVIWDAIERTGLSAKMHAEAKAFGIQHTFNIIEKTESGTGYYYFANNSNCKSINQVYLNNIDLLESFVSHFKDKLQHSSLLKKIFDHTVKLDKKSPGYSVKDSISLLDSTVRDQFLAMISPTASANDQSAITKATNFLFPDIHLTVREKECLYLTAKGKTAKQIAAQLSMSPRTVEHHIINVKLKLNVDSKRELVEKIIGNIIV